LETTPGNNTVFLKGAVKEHREELNFYLVRVFIDRIIGKKSVSLFYTKNKFIVHDFP
jgi:hypothetical protein